MPGIVQICGCLANGEEVIPFLSNEEADFYSVYFGQAGGFNWQADFLYYEDALTYAMAAVAAHGMTLDDKTYSQEGCNATKH